MTKLENLPLSAIRKFVQTSADLSNCKKSKDIEVITFFGKIAETFHALMKQRWDAGGGRTLLGDNTGGWTAMMWPIGFLCAGICFSDGLLYIPIFFLLWRLPIEGHGHLTL